VSQVTRRAAPFILLAIAAGCGSNEKQSLVLAELMLATPGTQATDLQSVALAAMPGPTKTYQVSSLSGDRSVLLGLYLPASVTGTVIITATAEPTTGCDRFRGTGNVTIDTAGVTKSVTILMSPDNACMPDGGLGGGGAGGATGSGGTGGGTAGTGGMTGTAGTGGSTGSAGSGGTAGSAGSGGTTGSAGTGGTTGSAGRGGATGAAGTGGTTGTAGTGGGGTTGTGGMAGYPSISSCRSFSHCTSCPNVAVEGVAISPNGQLVATAANDGRVKIWNFDGRTLTATTTAFTGFTGYGVAFAPDGTRLAFTSGATVKTYMVTGWTAAPTLQNDGSDNDMVSVGFTPNSQRIISVDAIGAAGGDLFVHDVGGGTLPALMVHISRQPASLAVSPVAGSDGSVGIAVGTYGGLVSAVTLGGAALGTPTDLVASATGEAVWAVAFTADGAFIVDGDGNGVVKFWSYPVTATASVGTDITFAGGDTVNAIAFTPNRLYMALGGAFYKAQLSIYTLSTRAESARTTPAGGDINAAVFSPNGAALIAGEDANGTVIVCN
jgi:hypothetical protein